MKHLLMVVMTLAVIHSTQAKETGDDLSNTTERLISENLSTLAFQVPSDHLAQVKHLILKEIVNGKKETEAALGRSTLYFPIFESFLRKYDLPEELKYLPYVETHIKARAVSHMGAAGLWQFMPYTGQRYQLRINDLVDDRYDPIRATVAATRYLQDLYVEFDDWLLALAAYNSGPGRVQKAIRLSRSKDFWKLRAYLPLETQQYIPKFIAAIYIGQFYEAHGLKPQKYFLSFRSVKFLKIHQGVQLNDLAKIADIPSTTLRLLNPTFKQGIVPTHARGNYVMVPAAALTNIQRYLTKIHGHAAQEIKLAPNVPIADARTKPTSSGNSFIDDPNRKEAILRAEYATTIENLPYRRHRWLAFISTEG